MSMFRFRSRCSCYRPGNRTRCRPARRPEVRKRLVADGSLAVARGVVEQSAVAVGGVGPSRVSIWACVPLNLMKITTSRMQSKDRLGAARLSDCSGTCVLENRH